MSLKQRLIKDEGWVAHAYEDSLGFITIGVGHLIDKRKGGELPYHIIDQLLDSDIENVYALLDTHLPWWRGRTPQVQEAMASMCFQLGIHGLMEFKKTLACLHAGDFEGAKANALDSLWAKQTPERAKSVTDLFTDKEAT